MMRRITIKTAPGAAPQSSMGNSGFNAPSGVYGMWGKVIARHSDDHTVDILTDRGFEIRRIPVASREWVTEGDVPGGGRDLPPEDTYVFMLMPTGQIESAFIIASAFPKTSSAMKDEFLAEDKEAESLSVIEGGWKKTYDKSKGDLLIEDKDDDNFILSVKKSEKKTSLTDWNGNTATIDDKGIAIQDKNANKVTLDFEGTKIEDKSGNTITMSASGIVVKDSSGNEVEMKATGATIKTIKGKITGGLFSMSGVVTPKGSGPFCAIPFCPITGMPHCGDSVVGT
ncbi:MAG: hypothetical protein SAMD01599839_07770 [Rectinema sp.]